MTVLRSVLKLAAATAVVIAGAPSPAAAQSAEAEKLFRDGKVLMKQGDIANACEAFDASQRLESDAATLLNLADCREKNGQLASAWGHFVKAESLTRHDPAKVVQNSTAHARAVALEPRLSYLTISVPDESRVDGLTVSRNGTVVDPGVWNRAVPIDGGEYEIEAKAPGHEPWTTKLTVRMEGDRESIEVPKFKELPKLMDVAAVDGGADRRGVSTVVVRETLPPDALTTRRKVAIGIAAGGLAAVIGGGVLGVRASGLQDDADQACPPEHCTPADAVRAEDLNRSARTNAMLANVAFALGGTAILGAGALWYFGAPPETESGFAIVPHASPTYAGLDAIVRF